MENTKRWLEEIRYSNGRLKMLREKHTRMRARMYSARTASISGTGGGRSGRKDIADDVAQIIALEAEYAREIDKLLADRRERLDVIEQIDDPRIKNALEMYYVDCLPSWGAVARRMPCDKRTIIRWHARGLEQVDKIRRGKSQ